MRLKVEYRTVSKESYNTFIVKYPSLKSTLSYDKYKENIYICNNLMVEYVLKTGNTIKLPHGFGDLTIRKKKLKPKKIFNGKTYINLKIDWAKTKKEGKYIYHTNEHSDGYNYRWIWKPSSARFFFSSLWNFKPHRDASRAIAKFVNKPNSNYKDIYLEY